MIEELAKKIDDAAFKAKPIEQLSISQKFNELEAYNIQKASIERRIERGEKLVGVKLGFTSKAKMEQMGVHDMIWGRLTDAMLLQQGVFAFDKHIHPRAEPEICFRVKKDITSPIGLTELSEYIDGVAAAIEVIDSRYKNFKFSLEDVIADNCSSAAFIVGDWCDIDQDINHLKMDLCINGETIESGTSHAILNNPWESVVAAARLGTKYNQPIVAGSFIMAGAATPAVFLEQGQTVEVQIEKLGSTQFKVI